MPIEFRCKKCNTLLRTPDDSAGQQAKCPKCGDLTTIPLPAAAMAATLPGRTMAPPAAVGGYQAPSDLPPAPAGPSTPTRISVGKVISESWGIYKQNMGLCIGAVFLATVINGVANQMAGMLGFMLSDGGRDEVTHGIVTSVVLLPIWFLGVWLHCGLIHFLLKFARNAGPSLGDIFSGGPWVLPVAGASLMVWIIVMLGCIPGIILFFLAAFGADGLFILGFIFLIIPGIILFLMLSQTFFLIVDRNLGVFDAMGLSREITRGNKLRLFLLVLAVYGLNLLGALALLVGLIVTIPLSWVIAIVAYLTMSGQFPAAAE